MKVPHLGVDGERNIVLIGMRGSGKSEVGELLAHRMDRSLLDTDKIIVRLASLTIPEIIERHGWDDFRDRESSAVEYAGRRSRLVIATGGGIVLRAANVEALRANGTIVLLTAEPHVLAARIGDDPNRPPLTDHGELVDELSHLWAERQLAYCDASDISVRTDELTVQEVVNEVLLSLALQ